MMHIIFKSKVHILDLDRPGLKSSFCHLIGTLHGPVKLPSLSDYQLSHLENMGLQILSHRVVVRVKLYNINACQESHRCSINISCSYELHSFLIQKSAPRSEREHQSILAISLALVLHNLSFT